MYLDKDCMDYPRDIILDYELNPENTLNYTPKDREKYLVNTLSRRVNVAPLIDFKILDLIQIKRKNTFNNRFKSKTQMR